MTSARVTLVRTAVVAAMARVEAAITPAATGDMISRLKPGWVSNAVISRFRVISSDFLATAAVSPLMIAMFRP